MSPARNPRPTSARGYGTAHQRERARWERIIAAGGVMCARQGPRCVGKPIQPGQAWDLGHTDDRTAWTGPECVPCNRGEGGRRGAAVTNGAARSAMTVREW